MKKQIITLVLVLLSLTKGVAHYLWIETNATGDIGKTQEIKVFFGEYTSNTFEAVGKEAFEKVKNFNLWVITADGKKISLKATPKDSYYLAHFTPKTNGTYTVVLNNNNIEVIDYTKYDFGIFKTHYHATTKIEVGNNSTETAADNNNGIVIKNVSENENDIKLQVLYKNKPLAKNELTIFLADLWSKKVHTDENGMVSFKLPWDTKYIVETTIKEEVPGVYKGENYQFIWHSATYCINKK